jgi:hypothetical protein
MQQQQQLLLHCQAHQQLVLPRPATLLLLLGQFVAAAAGCAGVEQAESFAQLVKHGQQRCGH